MAMCPLKTCLNLSFFFFKKSPNLIKILIALGIFDESGSGTRALHCVCLVSEAVA